TPSSFSSSATRRLTVDNGIFRRRAASEKLFASTTLTKTINALRSVIVRPTALFKLSRSCHTAQSRRLGSRLNFLSLSQAWEIHLQLAQLVGQAAISPSSAQGNRHVERTEKMNTDEKAVAAVLTRYQDALNQSDVDAVMKLYAPDAVFMPEYSPSSVGAAAVRKAYDVVFNAIALRVKFNVAEIKQVAPEWVFARTNSIGTVKVHATGETLPESNQELFVFQKTDGTWGIARYCFASTNPPSAKP